MNPIVKTWLPLLAAFLMSLSSCKFKPDEINWDTHLVAPLLKSQVTALDAVQDTGFLEVMPDQSLWLIYRDTLLDFPIAQFVDIPDTTYSNTVTLDSIRLNSETFKDTMSLGEIADQVGGVLKLIVDTYSGNPGGVPVNVPGGPIATGTVFPVNASSYFDHATLQTGDLVITIHNKLPTDISNVHFTLDNTIAGSLVADITIPSVPRGATTIHVEDLSGQYVEALMEGTLVGMDYSGITAGTVIHRDTQFIEITVQLKNLTASDAVAIFPEQEAINDQNNIRYSFGGGIELTRLGVKSGSIKVHAESSVQNPMQFTYTLPSAHKAGKVASISELLPAAPASGTSAIDKLFDLSGYNIDLTLNGDSVNIFPQQLIGKLMYTGMQVHMDLSDYIDIEYGIVDLIPSYVEGYIGMQEFHLADTVALEFFEKIKAGTLSLSDPRATLTFLNSIGADGALHVNDIRGVNTRTGNTVNLTGAPFTGSITVAGPRLPNVGQVVSTKVNLDKHNSTLSAFISNVPDRLEVDMDVVANETGIPSLHNNFASDQSRILALLDIETPLKGQAGGLLLETDMAVDMSGATLPEEVTEGYFRLVVSNDFPFDAGIQIYFFDASGDTLEKLFLEGFQVVPAGQSDAAGIVIKPGEAELSTWFDQARMERLRSSVSAKAVFRLDSRPAGSDVKVYSTHGIRFHLVGDFQYQVGMGE